MKPITPIFVARKGYRRRRMRDAVRILPVLGAFLLMIPLLWSGEDGGNPSTRVGYVYLFVIWALLIVSAAWLSRHLDRDVDAPPSGPDEERP